MERIETWDDYFIQISQLISEKSRDPSTKCGAVIVDPDNQIVSTGFNGFPRGVKETTHCAGYTPKNDFLSLVEVFNNHKEALKHPKELLAERWEKRPEKYDWVEHAERNAIYAAARMGAATKGCKMYLNYNPECCTDCARAIIQAGIIEVIGPDIPFPGKGHGTGYTCTNSFTMFKEAGVKIRTFKQND